ncbi:hypothetical protein [Acetobacter fallax]|uniref:Lipoprotein n=1 Tax=Acetobacter fallax TaxID=1737473 RepID=A0ABX0KJ66_9PROT|nr:hypothetical protein [Acetobacter fallax]NHO34425.1 hypothetical protein [Acetobacter fallax]NHO37983.1 hypothetical protein [Acetobacter fallax]
MKKLLIVLAATAFLSTCGSPVSGPGGATPANAGPDMDHDMPAAGTAHGAVTAKPDR